MDCKLKPVCLKDWVEVEEGWEGISCGSSVPCVCRMVE